VLWDPYIHICIYIYEDNSIYLKIHQMQKIIMYPNTRVPGCSHDQLNLNSFTPLNLHVLIRSDLSTWRKLEKLDKKFQTVCGSGSVVTEISVAYQWARS
jgi:hypothetical protein